MPTDRRAFLLGAATAASAALAGCGGDSEGGPRPPRENPPEGDGDSDGQPSEGQGAQEGYVYTPNVANWTAGANEAGNLTLEVELQSINPDPTRGTMRIRFETVDGEEIYTRPVEVDSEGTTNTTVDLPVSYDEYTINMSLPDFSFRNVTER